jgi:hypothetical protein
MNTHTHTTHTHTHTHTHIHTHTYTHTYTHTHTHTHLHTQHAPETKLRYLTTQQVLELKGPLSTAPSAPGWREHREEVCCLTSDA